MTVGGADVHRGPDHRRRDLAHVRQRTCSIRATRPSVPEAQQLRSGTHTTESFMEVRLAFDQETDLYAGQRAVVRFTGPKRPLIEQWWRKIQQTVSSRWTL